MELGQRKRVFHLVAIVLGLFCFIFASGTVLAIDYFVEGTVKDIASGSPMAGVVVTIKDGSNNSYSSPATNASGQYTVPLPGPGDYTVFDAVKAGYTTWSAPQVPVTLDAQHPNETLQDIFMALSGPEPFVFNLAQGWNLVSLPLQPSVTSIGSVLGGIAGNYSVVWAYINQQWKFYDPTDVEGSTLTTMEAGLGYWIKMTIQRQLTVSGSFAPDCVNLLNGWNLVGYGKAAAGASTDVLAGISGKYVIVWAYPSQQWKFFDPTDVEGSTLGQFLQGYGYWIKATQNAQWCLP